MLRRFPLRFALGIALAALLVLVRPEWVAHGLLGALLVGYTAILAFIGVFVLLVVASDAVSRPENRLAAPMPWPDVAMLLAGLGVLLWVVVVADGRQMALTIGLSAVLVGGAMFAFARWNAARSRPTSS